MMEKIVDEKLAANWHGRRNIGAKLKPEVYKSAVLEQGCLDMGGSDKCFNRIIKQAVYMNLFIWIQKTKIEANRKKIIKK